MWAHSKGPELVQHVHSAFSFAAGCLQSRLMLEATQRTFLVVLWQELFIGNTDGEHWFVINNKIRLPAQDMMTKPKYLSACYEIQ